MAQRVDYASFPGVRDEALLSTVNKVFGHIRRNQWTAREFRDWMKEEGLYNKDDVHHLLAFLDIQTDGVVRLGLWAEKFFAATTEEAMREAVYKRLLDENTLLVKYCLEALDTEGGGRLHSTHELHRMLTSYVYPGKPITLEPFKNWIRWAVVSGRLKMIGIRWGMTDLGKQAVPRLRTIDVDEFLEDEKAEGAAAEVRAAQAQSPAAPRAVPPPAPAPIAAPEPSRAATAKPAPRSDDDPDEDLDIPGEAEPVDEAAFARYAAQYEEPAPAPAPSAAPAPAAKAKAQSGKPAPAQAVAEPAPAPVALEPQAAPTTLEVQVPTQRRDNAPAHVVVRHVKLENACSRAALEPAEVVAALRDHGRAQGLGGGSLLLGHGLETRIAHNEPLRHLFLASLLARAYAATGDGSLVDALTERVGGSLGPVALLLDRPEALVDALNRWNLLTSDPIATQLRALILEAAIGGKALKLAPDLPAQLAEAASSEALVQQLTQTVLRGAHPLAALWLVREMVRVGLWTRPAATEVAFVPWRAVRLMAYRLRLIDSHFAAGLPLLLQVAKRLAALLPPGSVEAAAIEALAPGDHLRFDCNAVVVCQTPCAWHRSEP